MQNPNPKTPRKSSTIVELVAVVSMIILIIALLIPVVQSKDDDAVARRVAQKISRIHQVSYPSTGSSASVKM